MRAKNSNNRKNVKKFLILLSLISVIFTIYEITSIYAVFYSETSGLLSQDIAKWKIIVNNKNIVAETIQNFEIERLTIENGNAINGKITPGVTGSFEIEIDPTDTQVSIRYDIIIDDTNLKNSDVKLINVSETEVENTIIRTDKNTYTGIILLDSIKEGYINNIKLTFKWEEDETSPDQDIEVGEIENPIIQVPISVKAIQYLGEQITPYTD